MGVNVINYLSFYNLGDVFLFSIKLGISIKKPVKNIINSSFHFCG